MNYAGGKMNINTLLLKWALRIALEKKAPARILLSGEEGKKTDCYTVVVRGIDGCPFDVLVDGTTKNYIEGRTWEEDRYQANFLAIYEMLGSVEFSGRHFYRGYSFEYNSPFKFLINTLLKIPQIIVLKNKFNQWIFNSKTPNRTDRIELLKKLIDIRINNNSVENIYVSHDEGLGVIDIMIEIYGNRIIRHPEYNKILRQNKLILESLVTSKDIEESRNFNITVTGKAFTTIATYEEENRRHDEQMQHNRYIKYLTVALVFVGFLQVVINNISNIYGGLCFYF